MADIIKQDLKNYDEYFNEIFKELIAASEINIYVLDNNDGHYNDKIQQYIKLESIEKENSLINYSLLGSVNGTGTFNDFSNKLNKIKKESIDLLAGYTRSFYFSEKINFLDYIKTKVENFNNILKQEIHYHIDENRKKIKETYLTFKTYSFKSLYVDLDFTKLKISKSEIKKLSNHSQIWFDSINNIKSLIDKWIIEINTIQKNDINANLNVKEVYYKSKLREIFKYFINEIENPLAEFEKPYKDGTMVFNTFNGYKSTFDYETELMFQKKYSFQELKEFIETLSLDEKITFLEYLKINLKKFYQYIGTDLKIADKIKHEKYINTFYKIKFKDTISKISYIYIHLKQKNFHLISFNYELCRFADIYINTIKNIERELNKILEYYKSSNIIITDNKKVNDFKFETNLSVAQLAYLFNILLNDKSICEYEKINKTNLFVFLANSFETTGTESCSPGTINKFFYTPDPKSIEFWYKEFQKYSIQLQKIVTIKGKKQQQNKK